MEKRIQRLRKKGWCKPPDTLNVTRPGRWGNPYRPSDYDRIEECLEDYRRWVLVQVAVGILQLKEIRDAASIMCWCNVGALIFLGNQCKLPRDQEIAARVRAVDPDPDEVFATPEEFCQHHLPGSKIMTVGHTVHQIGGGGRR